MNRRQLLKTLVGGAIAVHEKKNILKVVDCIVSYKPKRRLKTNWAFENGVDLRAIHGLDAEEELAAILSDEIRREIDREIMNHARYS